MPHSPQTRAPSRAESAARIRPTTAAAAFGGLVGLAIGCAYLGGQAAQAANMRLTAERIQTATAAGFTEEALSAAAGGLNASALAIARRHDPYTVAGSAQRDRQAELLTARLEHLRSQQSPELRRANFTAGPAAQPFELNSKLDASRDLECLTQAVYYEARGEGRDGMRAVAQVVLNRVRHPAFPQSVCAVVFQGAGRKVGCQFSFTCNGAMRAAVNRSAWNRSRDVASSALSGSVFAGVGNATHFHTTAVAPQWRNTLVRVNQVGSHLFYRFGGRNGASAAFNYEPRPSTAEDAPRIMQASMDPITPVRQAGEAVAYSLVVAQENLARGTETTPTPAVAVKIDAEAVRPAARPAPQPAAVIEPVRAAATTPVRAASGETQMALPES